MIVRFSSSGVTDYEITDHLGNVRAVFGVADNTMGNRDFSDYYPYGMPMPNRNIVGDYRYNYQGQELDPETGKVAFALRLYDSRINRWLSPDPYGQHASPYMSMGNNWANHVDPDGGMDCPDPPCNNDVSAAILLDEVTVSAPRMNNSWNTEGMYWNTTFQGNLNDWNVKNNTNFTNPRDAFDWYKQQEWNGIVAQLYRIKLYE